MKFFLLGIVALIAGIPLMSINFKLGMFVILIGGATSTWFMDEVFKKIFQQINSKSKVKPSLDQKVPRPGNGSAADKENPATASLLRAIDEKRKDDPLIGAKIGAKEVNQRLINAMKNEKGIHIESLLCALGSLAGYACQANIRAQALEQGLPETANLVVVETKSGAKYYFGDHLNAPLAESQHSIWSLSAGAAQHCGASTLPDISEIFKYTTETVGDSKFGEPRIPENHRPGDQPINYVKVLWPALLPVLKQFCKKPAEWPILFGLAIQDTLDMSKSIISPETALKIVMECAIPMSKIDLATV